jgi:hypothetical protein
MPSSRVRIPRRASPISIPSSGLPKRRATCPTGS